LNKNSNDGATPPNSSLDPSSVQNSISALWPSISVAALILVSVFNIGYFSNIGLHFLGLIDFTNVVYSIGLVFGGLVLAVNLLATALEILAKLAKTEKATKVISRILLIILGTLATIASVWLFMQPLTSSENTEAYVAILLSLIFIWAVAKPILRYQSAGGIIFSEIMFGLVAAVSADFAIGRAVAEKQLFQHIQLYTFSTKSGVVYGVNLIRSSSTGFIVAKDRTISFISKDEVKAITSEKPTKNAGN